MTERVSKHTATGIVQLTRKLFVPVPMQSSTSGAHMRHAIHGRATPRAPEEPHLSTEQLYASLALPRAMPRARTTTPAPCGLPTSCLRYIRGPHRLRGPRTRREEPADGWAAFEEWTRPRGRCCPCDAPTRVTSAAQASPGLDGPHPPLSPGLTHRYSRVSPTAIAGPRLASPREAAVERWAASHHGEPAGAPASPPRPAHGE